MLKNTFFSLSGNLRADWLDYTACCLITQCNIRHRFCRDYGSCLTWTAQCSLRANLCVGPPSPFWVICETRRCNISKQLGEMKEPCLFEVCGWWPCVLMRLILFLCVWLYSPEEPCGVSRTDPQPWESQGKSRAPSPSPPPLSSAIWGLWSSMIPLEGSLALSNGTHVKPYSWFSSLSLV